MRDIILWNKFHNNYRFTEPEYNILPGKKLNMMHPLSVEDSENTWNKLISSKEGHLMLVIKHTKNMGEQNQLIKDCGWGNAKTEALTKKLLKQSLKLDYNEPIIFFWDSITAIETVWGIFLEYWTDFCYPSDDSNIIIFHNDPRAIVYIEENIWIIDRKGFFGQN